MKDTFKFVSRSVVGLVGVALTSLSAVLFLSMFAIEEFTALGRGMGPYAGIIAYVILPALFVVGLLLIPIGAWRARVKDQRRVAAGRAAIAAPVIDLNVPRTRFIVLGVGVLTMINMVIVATATYKAVEVMDSSRFCGTACHTVMSPEYATYRRSPHARVNCTQCHIGPGANWFVKSKLSGSWQLISVAMNLFPRPIPTPVENLRPARETCEQCHWPSKFVGDRLKVIARFDEDENQTEKKTVLLLKIGGILQGKGRGIHWHVDPNNVVRYRSDQKRQHIYDIELTESDGTKKLFKTKAAPPADAPVHSEWRTMDCVDCHNRPTHVYRQPQDELDQVLVHGDLDRTLPYIKREGLRIIQTKFASHEEAGKGIRQALVDFYSQEYPELIKDKPERIDAAAEKLFEVYRRNVFPEMNITWGTYPNFQHHDGCFRCHDGDHQTEDRKEITQDCETCHEALATEEENPEILDILYP